MSFAGEIVRAKIRRADLGPFGGQNPLVAQRIATGTERPQATRNAPHKRKSPEMP
jgi:hypothetical protein